MTIFEYLVLRSEFEDLASKFILTTDNSGTMNNMKEFLETGIPKNRFREGCDRAIEIASLVTTEMT